MDSKIKMYADSGDLESLKYIFMDSLDVDPTFERYEEDYCYCKSIPGLLETHVELTPFSDRKDNWTEEYWASLKNDLKKNFSDERMTHMREVALVFMNDKVKRIRAERADRNAVQTNAVPKTEANHSDTSTTINSASDMTPRKPAVSMAEQQARQLEEARRQLEEENLAQQEREAREQAAKREEQHRMLEEEQDRSQRKKAKGIVIAALAAAIIVIVTLIIILLLK